MGTFDRNSTAREVLGGIDLSGCRIVLTGATSGIGIPTAEALAQAGADLVIGARNTDKLNNLIAELGETAKGKILGFPLDLMSFESIDAFADEVISLNQPIDRLINNAGIIGQLQRSQTGLESQLMTNFIGHALLTSRLAGSLKQSTSPRLISLSSFGHHYSPVQLEDLNFTAREYSPWSAYGQSKTACALLAVHVTSVTGVDAFAVHPGAIITNLGHEMNREDLAFAAKHGSIPAADAFQSAEQGAATTVWAATAPELSGRAPLYLENCGIADMLEAPNYQSGVMPYALDINIANELWKTTEHLIERRLPL